MTRAERAPSGLRCGDQRPYAVPATLAGLGSPRGGTVTLDRSAAGTYDLDDAGDLQLMYQCALYRAVTPEDSSRWLDKDLLRHLWFSLWLPARLRALWESHFSDPAAPLKSAIDRDSAVAFGCDEPGSAQ